MKALRFSSIIFTLAGIITMSCTREPVRPPEPTVDYIKIRDLRALYDQGWSVVDSNVYIQGIITLTPEFKNLPSFIAYIQDSTAGICLTVTGTNTLTLNSEVKILCRDLTFTDYNGLLQFGDLSIEEKSELVSLDPQPPLDPVPATIAEILAGEHQGEYVVIENVQFKDPGTYSGSKTLTDCNSSIDVYTRSDATFSGETIPVGNGTFKGVASVYNSKQLLLRDPAELLMSGDRCGIPSVVYLTQDFNTLTTNYTNVNLLTGWKTYSQAGTKTWFSFKTSTLGPFIETTAYSSNPAYQEPTVITWMIAPQIDLATADQPYVQFESADGYDNGATLELFASTDYTGTATPWTGCTWTKLTFTLPPSTNPSYSSFVSSGQVDLSAYKGSTVYLAWVYKGGYPSKTTTWEVDNIVIAEK